MSKKINRKDLYDLLWSKSWFVITDQFNLSRFRLLKICKDNRIPAPSNDWWTEDTIKEISNKPELYVDDSYSEDSMIEIVSDREIRQTRISEIKEDIEESCGEYLTAPKRLFSPDLLTMNSKVTYGINESSRFQRDKIFINTDIQKAAIFVTKENIGRSLRILDTFIKLIKARGHSIEMENHEYKIRIGSEYYEFNIREKQKRIESKERWRDNELQPTGLLILAVGRYSNKKEFIDSGIPLEQKLSMALAYLEYIAEVWKETQEVNEINRIKREEEERIAQEIEDRQTHEIERFHNLIKHANEWSHAKVLREFINDVEIRTQKKDKESENVLEWINWARGKVDEYDPLSKTNESGFNKLLDKFSN